MKRQILICLIWFAFSLSATGHATVDTTSGIKYRFAVEMYGATQFYAIPMVYDAYKTGKSGYKSDKPGVSPGLLLHYNFKKNFYFSVGSFYSQSSFTVDTAGIFPQGSIFPNGILFTKRMAYVDVALFFGKDFYLVKDKFLLGIQIGTAQGTLVKGREYYQGYSPVINPNSYFPPHKQFNRAISSSMFGFSAGYCPSTRLKIKVLTFYRMYSAIDKYQEAMNYGSIKNENKKIYHKLWNFGIGIQYNFLPNEKVKKWCKKRGS